MRRRGSGRRWPRKVAFGVPLALVAVLGLGWVERRPIAAHFVDRALADAGVRGRYRIESIGVFRQRLTGLSLGDPARPDLTARDVTLRLRWGATGPSLAGVTARGVRLRGRVAADGSLSFGAVDRLLPAPTGAPFALPDLTVDLDDALVDLATPAGAVRAGVSGAGRLTHGFAGRVVLAAPVLRQAGCRADGVHGSLSVRIVRRASHLSGPLAAGRLDCDGAAVVRARADVAAILSPALDRWSGRARIATGPGGAAGASFAGLGGDVRFAGDRRATAADVKMMAARPAMRGGRARAVTAEGRIAGGSFDGTVRLDRAAYPLALAAPVTGTPVDPVAARLVTAANAAARDLSGTMRVTGRTVTALDLRAASGARIGFAGRLTTDGAVGTATLAGGGLPDGRIDLDGQGGVARLAPVVAGDARLALSPVRFARVGRDVRVTTVATLDGPVPGGRVGGLSIPIAARIGLDGAALAGGCLPVAAARLRLAGFDFRDARTIACPVAGGVTVAALRLAGTSAAQPARLSIDRLRFAGGRLSTGPAALVIGPADRFTRLELASLSGTTGPGGLSGTVAGLAGTIAAVPLVGSDGAGRWSLTGGRLALDGALRVADAQPAARFVPVIADGLNLTLIDGRIAATATLRPTPGGVRIADVAIDHLLSSGTGRAVLTVPGLTFGPDLQPEALTRLTLGIVANVRGTVAGRGDIAWGPDGVTSTGRFATDGLDLAAAFGPVTGIRTTITFSDLLALETPPGQVATIAEVNPGIAVADGEVRYRLLPGQVVQVQGGGWPFAGGRLELEPATMDFARDVDRRLVFAMNGLDAARFVQTLGFENIAATGIFDGRVPMIFGAAGARLEGGLLTARPGGGTVAYVGELTRAQLGTFGKLAFDALRSMRYRNLSIGLDGALDGEIVSRVNFAGVNQEPLQGTKTPFRSQLRRLPFVFNITVRAPFRGLVGSARGFADPTLFIRDRIGVQTSESEAKP